MAKNHYKKKQDAVTPVEEPWIVVGAPGSARAGKMLYLGSSLGITEERARELASRLSGAVAVPAE
jgi:hypothetical protein